MNHIKEVIVIVKDENTALVEQRRANEEGLINWLFVNVNRLGLGALKGVRAKRIYVQPGVVVEIDTVHRELRPVYLPGYD